MIYSIDDLCSVSYDNEQIEDVSKNLLNSLIVGMFHYAKIDNLTDNEIIELIRKDNDWFNKYYWTTSQRVRFIKKLNQVFLNLYNFGPNKCQNSSIEWIMKYGLKNKELKKTINRKQKTYKK